MKDIIKNDFTHGTVKDYLQLALTLYIKVS